MKSDQHSMDSIPMAYRPYFPFLVGIYMGLINILHDISHAIWSIAGSEFQKTHDPRWLHLPLFGGLGLVAIFSTAFVAGLLWLDGVAAMKENDVCST